MIARNYLLPWIRREHGPISLAITMAIVVALSLLLGTRSVNAVTNSDEDAVLEFANQPWTGDLDGIYERGLIRFLTVYNPLLFFYDGADQKGIVSDAARLFEEHLNKKRKRNVLPIKALIVTVSRDELLPALLAGKGDLVAANLTITPERKALVQFADPVYTGVKELIITGPGAPVIKSLDDLTSTSVFVRESSSYYEHLIALNKRRSVEGRADIPVHKADENLEDYDLVEMVNAGLIPAVVVDSHKATFWSQIFDKVTVHHDLAINEGGEIAWAMRKKSPQLLKAVNAFVKSTHKGTLLGNIILKRYLGSTKWIDNALSNEGRHRYEKTIDLIKKYSEEYDFDWLMIAAQGYQESKLDQNKKSHVGAIGVMQLMPQTAADPNVDIPNIHKIDNNIHAGVKYLRFLRKRYFDEADIDPFDKVLFSFAAYNAGPAGIARARKKAVAMGFNPNIWFGNVEVAASRAVSREPVIYVRNIYKYFVAYKLFEQQRKIRDEAKDAENR